MIMDKRKENNMRVKRKITDALFLLMSEKSLADIHITELVKKAGVARASFYRNYSSKENVLVTLIQDILDEFREEINLEQETMYIYENVLLSFQYFLRYRKYILDMHRSGFTSVLMEELNHFHESIEGSMSHASIEKYGLYMYVGALLNTAVTWLLIDEETDCEDISKYFFETVLRMRNT